MATYLAGSQAFEQEKDANGNNSPSAPQPTETLAGKYRGATVEDLDPPPALSTSPDSPIAVALQSAFERDYTHLTVVSSSRSLIGYLSIPRLKELLQQGVVKETDPVEKAMLRFRRKGNVYTKITMDTPLEDLERFFSGELADGTKREKQDFAVVTDFDRKFVLGVATKEDLENFTKRRPTQA
ncbi:hypothetical protein KEM56_004191 [Ascosphaera pollenicola]|nr:hypothetical protein KEM56_004191 [Ascosphaera pollenicola]